MSSQQRANDRQVGGDHYATNTLRCPHCNHTLQHWDLFGKASYLLGNITKYLLRHRDKHGRLDLEKAGHYLQKYIEVEYPDQLAHHTPETLDAGTPRESPEHVQAVVQAQEAVGIQHVGVVQVTDLDAYAAQAARDRADAYARQAPDADVPAGWEVEQQTGTDTWKYRRTTSRHGLSGMVWEYAPTRQDCIEHIKAIEGVQIERH